MTGFGGGSNLPPGCSVSDIPGNRPEDGKWEALIEHFFDPKRIKERQSGIIISDLEIAKMNSIYRLKKYQDIQETVDAYITMAIEFGMEVGVQEERENRLADHGQYVAYKQGLLQQKAVVSGQYNHWLTYHLILGRSHIWNEYFNPDDAEAVYGTLCPECHQPMRYHGFHRMDGKQTLAWAVCANCEVALDF